MMLATSLGVVEDTQCDAAGCMVRNSNTVRLLQNAINRYASKVKFAPIGVDAKVGNQTVQALAAINAAIQQGSVGSSMASAQAMMATMMTPSTAPIVAWKLVAQRAGDIANALNVLADEAGLTARPAPTPGGGMPSMGGGTPGAALPAGQNIFDTPATPTWIWVVGGGLILAIVVALVKMSRSK